MLSVPYRLLHGSDPQVDVCIFQASPKSIWGPGMENRNPLLPGFTGVLTAGRVLITGMGQGIGGAGNCLGHHGVGTIY